jgi:glycosyltransferase involved in cell wall biosynthesis
MKIGIDIRCLSEGRRTGVEEYTINLLKNLFERDRENQYLLFFNSWKKPMVDLSWIGTYSNVSLKVFHYPNKLLNFLFWYFRFPKIDKMLGGADIFFLPNIAFGSFSPKTKLILTIHDLSFERYPETFSFKRRLWHWFINPRRLVREAKKIISVSESTKNDIVEIYGVNSEKIEVIHSAVSQNFKVINRNDTKLIEVKEKYSLPYKFILFLGTLEPRKNIISLVRAYDQLRKLKHPELEKYKLVIAGYNGWKYEKLFSEIRNSEFSGDISLTGPIADDDKAYLYNLASVFVYPSFFEGFGFPPLEAMACGVPVIASNNSSFPEIIGDSGILIDPDRPDEIEKALKAILLNRELREKLVQKGLKQANKFGWSNTAKDFLEILDKLRKLGV